MSNKIAISDAVLAFEEHALSEFYRNRLLVAAQRLADADDIAARIAAERDEARAELASVTAPKATQHRDDDTTLATMLRQFVNDGFTNEATVVRLMDDARRVIEGGGQ